MNATILQRGVIKYGAPPQKHGQQKNGMFVGTQQVSRKTHWRVARRPYSKIYGGNNTSIDHLTAHNKTILLYLLHQAAIFCWVSWIYTNRMRSAQDKIRKEDLCELSKRNELHCDVTVFHYSGKVSAVLEILQYNFKQVGTLCIHLLLVDKRAKSFFCTFQTWYQMMFNNHIFGVSFSKNCLFQLVRIKQ